MSNLRSANGFGSLSMATEQTCRQLRTYRKRLAAAAAAGDGMAMAPDVLMELDQELRLTLAALGSRAIRSQAMSDELDGMLDEKLDRLVSLLDEKWRVQQQTTTTRQVQQQTGRQGQVHADRTPSKRAGSARRRQLRHGRDGSGDSRGSGESGGSGGSGGSEVSEASEASGVSRGSRGSGVSRVSEVSRGSAASGASAASVASAVSAVSMASSTVASEDQTTMTMTTGGGDDQSSNNGAEADNTLSGSSRGAGQTAEETVKEAEETVKETVQETVKETVKETGALLAQGAGGNDGQGARHGDFATVTLSRCT